MAEEMEQAELVALLKSARAAIGDALTNLGESPDDEVSGYALGSLNFRVATSPELASRMGSQFQPGLAMDGDGSCVNILCGGAATPGGDVMNPG